MNKQILQYSNSQVAYPFCPICQSSQVYPFLEINDTPVYTNNLWPERDLAVGAPRGTIRLAYCQECGHIYNQVFQPELMEYTGAYENSLHFSPRFGEYSSWLVDYLIERYALRGKSVIEFGSGKGEFLSLLCERGQNVGMGFDPSYQSSEEMPTPDPRVEFIRDTYSEEYADFKADFLLSRQTLEHLANPAQFIRSLYEMASQHRKPPVFVEVPNAAYLVRKPSYWDIIYEHFSYFSAASLAHLFNQSGFETSKTMDTYAGQFLCLEAVTGNGGGAAAGSKKNLPVEFTIEQLEQFARRYQEEVDGWRKRLASFHQAGKKAVIWGAGSKGITFLNALRPDGEVPCVVDLNPRKTGNFIVGTGHEIILPAALRQVKPDLVIVMNPIYLEEITGMLAEMGLRPELVQA